MDFENAAIMHMHIADCQRWDKGRLKSFVQPYDENANIEYILKRVNISGYVRGRLGFVQVASGTPGKCSRMQTNVDRLGYSGTE